MTIYRSIKVEHGQCKREYPYRDTMRPPENIPYIVDNLWEWKRPEKYPNRRFSAYGSPSHALAFESGPENGTVFKVEFPGEYKIAQLSHYADSKFHPECRTLKKNLINLLKQETGEWWINWDLALKQQIAPLWMPCLKKNEVESLFKEPLLQNIKDKIAPLITYWNDVILIDVNDVERRDEDGEIFFEAKGGYRLVETGDV